MVDHDHSYKLLFAHPEMVRDLLKGFVHGRWLARLDFSTLERVSCAYVSDHLQGRAGDIVWRARCGDRYVYISIEFQSTSERAMGLRVLAYVILLYQELLREKKVSLEEGLPTVIPIVLYNGKDRWWAPTDFGSLLCESPEGAEQYRPQFRYLLIDEGRYHDRELAASQNLVAMLFRLEHGCRGEQIRDVAHRLMAQLASSGLVSLRRAFEVWLERVSRARFVLGRDEGAVEIPERPSMLADRIDEWEAELLQKGRHAGREEGREEGRLEGEAALLACLLRKRFGDVPAWILGRLSTAEASQLERWAERLLDAGSASEVFETE